MVGVPTLDFLHPHLALPARRRVEAEDVAELKSKVKIQGAMLHDGALLNGTPVPFHYLKEPISTTQISPEILAYLTLRNNYNMVS